MVSSLVVAAVAMGTTGPTGSAALYVACGSAGLGYC